ETFIVEVWLDVVGIVKKNAAFVDFLKEGGVLLYDSDNVEPNLDDRRFVYVGVPITGLTIEALGGTAKDKGKNIFVLGLISKIFSLDVDKLKKIISEKFAGKDESIVNTAMMAFQAGYAYPVGKVLTHQYQFEHIPKTDGRAQITMDGNQAIAYGLIAAGVRYGAGYPITPWSSVMETLRRELPKYGGIFVQAEDELGAVSIALGFSYSGYLAVTGSAGPGISLKTEAIGWASMAEIPLIICNIQRGGPSTGLPTNVEQSDLHQAIFGGHGDSPRVVLAAATVEDCFYIAIEATRIARKYSTPVFILSDSSLATRIEAFHEPDFEKVMIEPAPDLTPRQSHVPYPLDQITQHIPPGTRILDGKYPLLSGLEQIFANFKRIVTVEMNDQGLYGFGQLATILRARYCEPKIESVTKTDGLTYRVKEILQGVFPGKFVSARGYSPNRPIAGNGEQDVDLARHESITQGVG